MNLDNLIHSSKCFQEAPPHTRGSTKLKVTEGCSTAGSPAHAGIDRFDAHASEVSTGLPRTRGDRPLLGTRARRLGTAPHARFYITRQATRKLTYPFPTNIRRHQGQLKPKSPKLMCVEPNLANLPPPKRQIDPNLTIKYPQSALQCMKTQMNGPFSFYQGWGSGSQERAKWQNWAKIAKTNPGSEGGGRGWTAIGTENYREKGN